MAADEISKIKNGDYLDISLGLPYTTVDNHTYVFSYGAVNKDNQTPIYYQGIIVGYLVPAGNTESYKQSVPQYSGQGRLILIGMLLIMTVVKNLQILEAMVITKSFLIMP